MGGGDDGRTLRDGQGALLLRHDPERARRWLIDRNPSQRHRGTRRGEQDPYRGPGGDRDALAREERDCGGRAQRPARARGDPRRGDREALRRARIPGRHTKPCGPLSRAYPRQKRRVRTGSCKTQSLSAGYLGRPGAFEELLDGVAHSLGCCGTRGHSGTPRAPFYSTARASLAVVLDEATRSPSGKLQYTLVAFTLVQDPL